MKPIDFTRPDEKTLNWILGSGFAGLLLYLLWRMLAYHWQVVPEIMNQQLPTP
ncbi:hypothetical protein [Fibrisoma montanum]|uniref:hypothetical protein n=1 Tax=Fibrisoma montanum TaxID=2305895 RepID=UPI0013147EE2|nr:hypothetical protein [Fibrisoma montanum]